MLIRRHSTKKLSARFPREMPACAKRARFYCLPTEDQEIWANCADSSVGVAKHVCRAQHAVAVPQQRQMQMQTQQQVARLNKAAATKATANPRPKRDRSSETRLPLQDDESDRLVNFLTR